MKTSRPLDLQICPIYIYNKLNKIVRKMLSQFSPKENITWIKLRLVFEKIEGK